MKQIELVNDILNNNFIKMSSVKSHSHSHKQFQKSEFQKAFDKAKKVLDLQHMKYNPQWNKSLKVIKEQYSSIKTKGGALKKQLGNFALALKQVPMEEVSVWKHESIIDDASMHIDHPIPLKRAEAEEILPLTIEQSALPNPLHKHSTKPSQENASTVDFQSLLFTERTKRIFIERVKQAKQMRMKIQIKLLEKQMKSKLQKKIIQNKRLRQKMQLLKDIQQTKLAKEQQKDWEKRKKKLEQKLLHESSKDRAKMLRKMKKLSQKKELKEIERQLSVSTQNLSFGQALRNKQKYEIAEILRARQESISRRNSMGRSGSISIRQLKTSLTSRK